MELAKTSLISKALVKKFIIYLQKKFYVEAQQEEQKILSSYAKKTAHTIHKKIYWIKTNNKGNTFVTLQENLNSNCIFIIDEASMIPSHTDKSFGNRNLLSDLIKYVYSGTDCKLILIGDTAQLPPVHLDISPALDEYVLEHEFNKQIIVRNLTKVVRQSLGSLILENTL